MLQRFFVHLSLVLLFAFTQISVVTHEISHLNHPERNTQSEQHTQHDKHAASEACGQCIAYAQAASGVPAQTFVIPLNQAQFQLATVFVAHLASLLTPSYSARAPPLTSII
jgi:hypothetical protein